MAKSRKNICEFKRQPRIRADSKYRSFPWNVRLKRCRTRNAKPSKAMPCPTCPRVCSSRPPINAAHNGGQTRSLRHWGANRRSRSLLLRFEITKSGDKTAHCAPRAYLRLTPHRRGPAHSSSRRPSSASLRQVINCCAMDLGSNGLQRRPSSPWRISSGPGPVRVVTTALPIAIPSPMTIPCDSKSDG